MQFERGVFHKFRATQRIHIGGVGSDGETLHQDAVVEFDGVTVKGSSFTGDVPHLKAAIDRGYFVLVGGRTDVPSTKPVVTPTQNQFKLQQDVSQDDRPVGKVVKAADRAAANVRASDVTEGVTLAKPAFKRGDAPVLNAEASEGQVVGKLRNAAVQKTVINENNVGQIDRQIQSLQSPTGTGAVVVDKVVNTSVFEEVDTVTSTEEEPVDPVQQKFAVIRLSIPDFQWDLTTHWKSRVKLALTKYVSNPLYLMAILAVEADSVKKEILEGVIARQSL